MEYQQVIQIFMDCMLQWDSTKQRPKGEGFVGQVVAFAPAHEERGCKILHSNCKFGLMTDRCDALLLNIAKADHTAITSR